MKKTIFTVLAMAVGLYIPTLLCANEKEQTDHKKQKYANSRFVWTDNYVIEGEHVAMAPSTEEIVTTCLSKKGTPLRWIRKNDIYKFGKFIVKIYVCGIYLFVCYLFSVIDYEFFHFRTCNRFRYRCVRAS